MKTVAIIGCGKYTPGKEGWAIGHAHGNGYRETSAEIKLSGVDLSPENLQAFGEVFDLPQEQLFSSTDALYAAGIPDVVSICTWPKLHYPMVMEALSKGVKAIVCEKPFVLNAVEQRSIEQKAVEVGALVLIAHQRRCGEAFKVLKEVALSGKLGDDLRADAWVGDEWDILSWTTHWFDMANFMFDAAPEWVLAGMEIGNTRRYDQAIEDASVIYAEYADGRSAQFVTGPGTGAGFRLVGANGMAMIEGSEVVCMTTAGVERLAIPEGRSDFGCMLEELFIAMDGGAEPLCAIAHTAMATEMAYAAQESARTGRKVKLPLEIEYAPLEVAQNSCETER
jgi:predicted dehydrogenase